MLMDVLTKKTSFTSAATSWVVAAAIDLKGDEAAILNVIAATSWPLRLYPAAELARVLRWFARSGLIAADDVREMVS